MRKLIINLSVLLFIALPITLIGSYTLAYEILINQVEVETMKSINPIELQRGIEKQQTKSMCDGCAEYKENLKQVKLSDIPQPVLLCGECQLKFMEVNND